MHANKDHHDPVSLLDTIIAIRNVTRSLDYYDSIIAWKTYNGCYIYVNEGISNSSADEEVHANLVMNFEPQEDSTKTDWPSSPSKHGRKTSASAKSVKPNGNDLPVWKYESDINFSFLDAHGPCTHGS